MSETFVPFGEDGPYPNDRVTVLGYSTGSFARPFPESFTTSFGPKKPAFIVDPVGACK